MPSKKKEPIAMDENGWGHIENVAIFELPPENHQAYDIGIYCLYCGATIMTHVMRYDGCLNMQLPPVCPICYGKGE